MCANVRQREHPALQKHSQVIAFPEGGGENLSKSAIMEYRVKEWRSDFPFLVSQGPKVSWSSDPFFPGPCPKHRRLSTEIMGRTESTHLFAEQGAGRAVIPTSSLLLLVSLCLETRTLFVA